MQRRDLLAATIATVSGVGLAGCNGALEDDTSDSGGDDEDDDEEDDSGESCATPGENLEDSLPDSDQYEIQGEPSTGSGDGEENIEATAGGFYVGPDDGEFIFSIMAYSSEDVAVEEADSARESSGGSTESGIGFIQTGAYIFVAVGPNEEATMAFMKTSPALSDGCVDSNVEFIGGESESETSAPTASFSFEYRPDSNELTITHTSGDQIRAKNLYVRGDFDGGDRNDTWTGHGGSASGSLDGEAAVSAGDSVTVTAGSAYEIHVVWETDSDSATLSTASGPDA